MSNKRILIYLLGLLSVMFISLASVNNANAEESRVTITIKQNSNNQEGGNSGKEELDNQGSDNAKNEEASHQKENTTKKTKKKHILKLPETGEINSFEYIIFGIVILGISLLYIIKREIEELKMKKVNLAVAGLVALGTVAFVPSVNAAENQSGETTSSVEVKPGMLTIKEFPESIAFESQTITGKDMTAKESEESSISIEDLRGSSSKGWSLNASLKGEENFKGMALTLSPEITANGDVATSTEQTLNSKGQPIVTVADGDITKTDFDTSMKLHAKLDIPAKQLANTYSTTIVWNLTEGPGTAE